MTAPEDYRALVCVTTCDRPQYVRRYLPHFAELCARDPRLSLLVSLDGADEETVRFCQEWGIPLVSSERREGVGIAKNRAFVRFPEFDHYFFVEDDVELVDGSVFAAHVELARASGIHHFSLFNRARVRKPTGESTIAGHRVLHGMFGSAGFNFFTGPGLEQVGGWHPRFAEYRRWGHTEHSYRFYRSGLAPAPFNVARDLADTCIWHLHPSVTRATLLPADADQITAPERELIEQELRHVPFETPAPHSFNGVPFGGSARLAATLEARERYPLVTAGERRRCRSDYQLWRYRAGSGGRRRAGALLAAAWQWPANPLLRKAVRDGLGS